MRKVIADSSPLVAFIKKGELSILKSLFKNLYLPSAVHMELTQGIGANPEQVGPLQEAIDDGWIIVEPIARIHLPDLPLGNGESEAINACLDDPDACLLLMDEKKGRRIASAKGIKMLGTIGVLALAFKTKLQDKDAGKNNLQKLLDAGFYLSSDTILEFYKFLDTTS